MIISILDLGTNTFNLLVVRVMNGINFDILYEDKVPVKLGKGGINKNVILPDAYNRGIEAIENFYNKSKEYTVDKIFAFGTSALRNAENSNDFISEVRQKYDINIFIINGDKEAEYIYRGVKLASENNLDNGVIMDIGGGSTEFVICDNSNIFWKKSFEIGAARLLGLFRFPEPIAKDKINEIEGYFTLKLKPLILENNINNSKILYGASGAFETIFSLLVAKGDLINNGLPISEISLANFEDIYMQLITSTLKERMAMKGMPSFRAEYMVLAVMLINFVIKTLGIRKIFYSQFALKEGVLANLMDGL